MTDWPFIALTFLFFYLFDKNDSAGKAIFLGMLFYACMLTRYAGLFLIIPILTQPLLEKKSIRFYLVTLLVGLGLFVVTWIIPIYWMVHVGITETNYYTGIAQLIHFSFSSTLQEIGDLFLNIKTLIHFFPKFLASMILIISIIICIIGFIITVRTKKLKSTDSWVLATLLISLFFSSKYNRYLLPIAPFLIAYLLQGFDFIFRRKYWTTFCIIIWGIFLLAQDFYLLLQGNDTSYGGLNYLVSPTYNQFYKGYWNDLYQMAKIINESPKKGPIAFDNTLKGEKYLWFFTNQEILPLSDKDKASFLLISSLHPFSINSPTKILMEKKEMRLIDLNYKKNYCPNKDK